MANIGADYNTDTGDNLPGLDLMQSQPIPGIVHGAITGINGVVSPGLWDGADVPGVGFVPGLAGTKKVLGGAAKRVGGALENLTADPNIAPDESKNQPPEVSPAVDDQAPTRHTLPDILAGGKPPKGSLADAMQPNVLSDNSGKPMSQVGGRILTGPYDEANSGSAPGAQTSPIPGGGAAASPTTEAGGAFPNGQQGATGLPGMLGKLFDNISSWRDQNRLTLLAMAGGLAGSQSIGQGIGRGFTAAATVQPQQFAMNNQNATMRYFMSPQGGSMSPDMARAFSANPALTQEALGQMSGFTPPKTLTIQPGQNDVQWNPRTRQWEGLNGAAAGSANTDAATWDAMSTEDRLAAVAKQYGPDWAAAVRAVGEGRAIPPNRLSQIFPTAQHVYPGLDMAAYNARQNSYKNFYGGGKADMAIKQFDQALAQHAAGLPANIEANGNWAGGRVVNQPLNMIGDAIGTNTTFGPLQTNAHALVDELAALWKASGSTDAEIKAWGNAFHVNGTIPQQKKDVGELVNLAEGATNALEGQRQREFGPSAAHLPPVVSPQSRATLDKLKAWAADPNAKWSGGGPQSSPQAINQGAIILQGGHHYQHMPDGSFKQLD